MALSALQESPHTNRLAAEDSPYLLQHAHNPVDWVPWGDEAFAQARQRGVPLFVSSGYSACYWCHVMERESFEDPAVAAFLNEHFVPVKVDREQRPDVDAILMVACQAYTAATEGRPSGGWPLTVFLEPTGLRPFLAGTYFPKVPSHGRISFVQLLERIHQAWVTNRVGLEEQALRLGAAVEAELSERAGPVTITRSTMDRAAEGLLRYADHDHGGFGGAPKFPQPAYLEFLAAWQPKGPARDHVDFTLERMALGGVADQLGGGFHRYAVDGTWTVPHFEKMLYDQAQLLPLYAEAAARTSNPLFRATAEGLVRAMHREFERPDGLFDAAIDAEVDGREGGSFLWSPDEARTVLQADSIDPATIDATLQALGLDGRPNFRDPHHPDAPPAWVLTMRSSDEAVDPELRRARDTLLQSRDARKQPRRDDKAILGWNGLAIAGLAEAGAALQRPEWVDMAARAALACQNTFRAQDGAWLHAKRTRVDLPATLEDLACLIRGLHALALATGDSGWAARALLVADDARRAFFDPVTGNWYESAVGRTDLFVRPAGMHDGAVPSGPGEMLAQLPWLEQIDPSGTWKATADASFRAASGAIAAAPTATCRGLIGYLASGRLGDAAVTEPSRRIGPESPVEVSVVGMSVHVRMPDGWKIVARAGGSAAQTLTGLAIRSRTDGVRASWTLPTLTEAADGSTYLSGSFEIPITLSGPGAGRGARADLEVTWQACNATACLLPESRTLTLTIP